MNNSVASKAKSTCCGCRSCEQLCPQECITIREDEEGFSYPQVDPKNCTNCGICLKTCSMEEGGYVNPNSSEQAFVYATRHNDMDVLKTSTSGGAFTAIATAFCDGNYAIFGAAMDDKLVVRHIAIRDISEIGKFKKSKYVQSDIGRSYSDARELLEGGTKVLFSGTPCQIAGLQKFLGKHYDKLLTIEVLCHGVPSPKVFELYKKYLVKKHNTEIDEFDFRDKRSHGWNVAMAVKFKNGWKLTNYMTDDLYGNAYLNSLSLRPSCYECPYARQRRNADITLGDFWGIDRILPDYNRDQGVSLVIVNTELGKDVFSRAAEYLTVTEVPIAETIPYNMRLKEPTKPHPGRDAFMRDIMSTQYDRASKKYLTRRSLPRKLMSAMLSSSTRKKIKQLLKMK